MAAVAKLYRARQKLHRNGFELEVSQVDGWVGRWLAYRSGLRTNVTYLLCTDLLP